MCFDTAASNAHVPSACRCTADRQAAENVHPVADGAHSAGDLAGTSAGAISDQTQATPRKFNGANDYVLVSQNKLGTYCDVTIDTWIKFGRDALSTGTQCSQLGSGWTQGTGSAAFECPGTVRTSLVTPCLHTTLCPAALSRSSRAAIGCGRATVLH